MARHVAQSMADRRLAHNHKPGPTAQRLITLMERERSCDAVAKATGYTIQHVWAAMKRWRPDLIGPRYIKRANRHKYELDRVA